MLFGLFGCGGVRTPEQAAQRCLEKKYGMQFTVGTLSRKSGSGPFKDAEYTGRAWVDQQPQFTFDVWVSSDLKTVQDSYYSAQMMPYIDDWMQNKAEQVWPVCKVRDQIEILRCNEDADYQAGDVSAFFKQELYSNSIIIYLPENEKTEELGEQVWSFLESVREVGGGWLTICFVPEKGFEGVDVYADELPDDFEGVRSISMGFSKEELLRILAAS